jgi:alpha-N-arabinofuranosidase
MTVSKAYFKEKADKESGTRTLPLLSASAARTQDGSIIIALTNVSLDKDQTLDIDLEGSQAKEVKGRILTAKNVADYNDFQHPAKVAPTDFKDAKLKKGVLTVKLPAKSVVVLSVK